MQINKYTIGFIGLLLIHVVVLLFLVDTYSISAKEASVYFSEQVNTLSIITNFSTSISTVS